MKEKDRKATVKFIVDKTNSDDLTYLNEWLNDSINNQLFKSYISANYIMDTSLSSFDTEKAKQNYLKIIQSDKRKEKRKKAYKWSVYAAAILVAALFITNYINKSFFINSPDNLNPVIVNNNIKPGENKAILTLENGEEITFVKGSSLKTKNAISNGDEIIYNSGSDIKELVYNTLTTPRGGSFFIKLSDGTKVWLNSETKLKYPINFIKGQTREVELVYGEAYFNVSHSSNHDGAHFKVLNVNQEIEVLGTKFNIKSYKNDNAIYTTLETGKVALNTKNKQLLLHPGEQTKLSKSDGEIIKSKVNVNTVVSWIDGNFDFNDVELAEIMKVLSRWYDMEVVFENESLKNERFTGRLSKYHSIENVLFSLRGAQIIKSFEINDKQLILK